MHRSQQVIPFHDIASFLRASQSAGHAAVVPYTLHLHWLCGTALVLVLTLCLWLACIGSTPCKWRGSGRRASWTIRQPRYCPVMSSRCRKRPAAQPKQQQMLVALSPPGKAAAIQSTTACSHTPASTTCSGEAVTGPSGNMCHMRGSRCVWRPWACRHSQLLQRLLARSQGVRLHLGCTCSLAGDQHPTSVNVSGHIRRLCAVSQ
jgi:hypothetical protein